MAGGTHAAHADVEARLGTTFTATGVPFTDAQVDAMCVSAERLVVLEIPTGKALPASADAQWKEIIVDIVINMMQLADKWRQAGGSTSTVSEMGTAAYPNYSADPITKTIRARIMRQIQDDTEAGGASYGDSLDSSTA